MSFKKLFLFIPLLLLVSSCAQKKAESSEQEFSLQAIVDEATFKDLEGNDVTLADYKGKVILIDFWETWCGPCLQVFPAMDKLQEEYPDDFVVLAVNSGVSDDVSDAITFSEQNSYDLNYLYDENAVAEEIGIYTIPYKIFIAPDGSVIKAHIGSYGTEGDYEFAKQILLEHKS